jgi:hypothetical protein
MLEANKMSDDLQSAQPLNHVAFPGNPTPKTRRRWGTEGVVGPRGEIVRLKTVRVGGRLFVEPRAVREFLDALNPEPDETLEEPGAGRDPSAADRKAAVRGNAAERSAAADLALETLGG